MIRKIFGLPAAVAIFLLAFTIPQVTFAQQWSMGFWTGVTRQPLSDLDWGGLTHIMHVALAPNSDGSLTYTCSTGPCSFSQLQTEASTLISTAHSHNVKVIVNLGNVSGSLYSGAISTNLSGFVNNIMYVVNTLGYDGVDIDWENSLNTTQMTSLLSNLRAALGTKLLTVDVDGSNGSYWASVQSYLDRISAMTYDMVGNWNPYSWFNSALYSDSCNCVWSFELMRTRLLGAGISAGKLNMGIPFYGWISTGGGITGPRQTGTASLSQSNYYSLFTNYNLSNPAWDTTTQTPWISISNGWITYDNERSVTAKVNYVKNNNLGGWIIWEIEQDYLPNNSPKHPLLTAIRNAMGTATVPAVAPTITSQSPLPSGTAGLSYSQALSASGTTPLTWSIIGGALPAGLSLNSTTGVVSGTPSVAGTYSFTAQASNSAGTNSAAFTLGIIAPATAPLIATTSPLPSATVGTSYSKTFSSSGSTPLTWSLTGGALPPGLAFSSSGVLSGTPSSSGTFTFSVTVSNSAGTSSGQFSITVNPALSSSNAAQFIGPDTTTQGSWYGKYGSDGYSIPNYATVLPAYAKLSISGASAWTWSSSTTDVRAVQQLSSTNRIAATWYSGSSFTMDLNLTDGASHRVGLYNLDWDNGGRSQRINIVDASTGGVLDSRSVSSFTNGQYFSWSIKGHVLIQVTALTGPNAVVSGLFFGAASTSATFVKADTSTQGNWKNIYGMSGYSIPNVGTGLPAFAQVSLASPSTWTWATSTTDVRALQVPTSTARAATTWYASPSFSVNLKLTDGQTHTVAIYGLDWDSQGRSETVQIVDAVSGQILDSRSLTGFSSGAYLVWNISGNVILKVTSTAGPNAVISGIFVN